MRIPAVICKMDGLFYPRTLLGDDFGPIEVRNYMAENLES